MKGSLNFIIVFFIILFLQIWNSSFLFSQQFTDVLKEKLPKPDQYKLMKAETFYDKGKAFIASGKNFPESQISDSVFYINNEMQIEAYYSNRIKASYCFKTSNGLLYNVLDKYIKEFWGKFKDDKKPLETIIKIENAAYDSLINADNLREMAEKEIYIDAKIPLVAQAEAIENNALFRLEKILFTYLNWPEKPNLAWILSDDQTTPNALALNQDIQVSSNTNIDATKVTSVYSLLRISENQIDTFNEFLQKKHPDKVETYLMDFQGLYQSVVDSLHKEWHSYLYSGNIAPDTIKSDVNPNVASVVNDKLDTTNAIKQPISKSSVNNTEETKKQNRFLFKVQITASRVRLSSQELKSVFQGEEEIVESFEDSWYKYTIGKFMTYHEARNCRNNIKVKGAFVIAYVNEKRINIVELVTSVE